MLVEADRPGLNSLNIFVDEASGFMYTQNQVSLGAAETVRAKHSFEREASRYGISILGYRADNGVYKSKAWSKTTCLDYIIINGDYLDYSSIYFLIFVSQ